MKIFGKELFNFQKPAGIMYDFAKFGILNNDHFIGTVEWSPTNTQGISTADAPAIRKPKKEKPKKTPKQLFKLKALNDNKFAINTDSNYLQEQLITIREKLEMIGPEKKIKNSRRDAPVEFELGGVMYGRDELKSILERLENRFKINEFKDILEKYPHTTSTLITSVIRENNHLRTGHASEFIPDFPKDAIRAMKEYNDMCIKLCNKKTNFYVIAKDEDFQQKNKRRDPILLAQSPFGFFWQILGAWDEEMIYLGDL